jgi:hypothetical protein
MNLSSYKNTMKRTILSVWLLIALVVVLFFLWKKRSTPTAVTMNAISTGSSVQQLLAQQPEDTGSTTGTEVTIQTSQLQWLDYVWWGEYKPFFAQAAKQLLQSGSHIILYFYKKWDPTDEALDTDIQKRIDRIPLKTTILRVDYDSNPSLKSTFGVTQQNTLIFLDSQGLEKTRRAVGITTLAQIVEAISDK